MMNVNDYTTGEMIGKADIDQKNYKANAQWPQGTIEAQDILSEEEIERLGISGKTIVFCD